MPYSIRTAIPPGTTSGPELADIVEEVGDLTQIVVESDTSNQPSSPSEGDAYIVNGDTSWVNGSQYDVAVFRDSTWIYHTPEEGWVAYIKDRSQSRRFNGTDWNSRLPDNSPEHATDSGTDAFVSTTNTDVPQDGDTVVRDFQSANGTTTPTLDTLTITTKDGSALWAGALSGVHELQYDGTNYLVLDPVGDSANTANAPVTRDANARAQFADPSADQDAATKGWALAAPGASTDPSLAFDTWRTPNADRTVEVLIEVTTRTDGSSIARVSFSIDESGGTTADYSPSILSVPATVASTDAPFESCTSFTVPAGASYRINNANDPTGQNAINVIREFVQ